MTYKSIVLELVRRTAEDWAEEVLKQNGIEYRWITASDGNLEMDKKTDTVYWEIDLAVYREGQRAVKVKTGGTVDDLVGICCSVIWNERHDIIWMNNEKTRQDLGITELKLAA